MRTGLAGPPAPAAPRDAAGDGTCSGAGPAGRSGPEIRYTASLGGPWIGPGTKTKTRELATSDRQPSP
jgi:hypothetical protein